MNAAHTDDAWDISAAAPSAFSDLFDEVALMKAPTQPSGFFGTSAAYNRGASGPREASGPGTARPLQSPPPPTAFAPHRSSAPAAAGLSSSSQGRWTPTATSTSAHTQDPYYHLQQLLNPAGSAPPECTQPEAARADCVVCYDPLPGRPTHGFFSSCHGGQICVGCAAKVDMCPLCRAPKPGREAAVANMLSSSGNCACSVGGGDIAAAAAAAPMEVESAESAESGTGVVGVAPRPESRHEHFGHLLAEHQDPEAALLRPNALFTAADAFEIEDHLDTLVGSGVFRGISGETDTDLDEFLVALRGGQGGGPRIKTEADPTDVVQLVLPDHRRTALAFPPPTPPPVAEPVRQMSVEPQQQREWPRGPARKRKKTAKAEAAELDAAAADAAAPAPTAPPIARAPTAARGGRARGAAAAASRALRDRNTKVVRTTAKPPAQIIARAGKTAKAPRKKPSLAKDSEVVGLDSPFTAIGLSDDRVCDMPFGDLVAAMETAGFSSGLTAEGKAYRKRLKNRRHVMQYSNRKKIGSTTLNGQNDDLKVKIVMLKKQNEKLVGVNGRLGDELRRATAVRHDAVAEMQGLQSQMAALQRAVASLTAGL